MTRITGAEARQLLEGTTPGPWEARHNGVVVSYGTEAQVQVVAASMPPRGDQNLVAAAPDLAETVAWLYDSDPAEQDVLITEGSRVGVYAASMHGQDHEYLTPDEAVDLARALLAAAEEARRGQ